MLDILLRKRHSSTFSRFFSVVLKLSYSDAVVIQKPKLKNLVEEDSGRVHKKEFKPHFIERLFVNKFQEDVLTYPELDTIEEVDRLKKHFVQTKNLITSESENNTGSAVLALKNHELIGFKIPRIKNGFGYLNSEYVFLQEALASDPSLAKTISEQEDFGLYLINEFGSDTQKERYLPKLASGENVTSFAYIEEESLVSLTPNSLSTKAVLLPDKESYIISGKKCWVYNANHADLFIVTSNITLEEGQESKPTIFLIDKNTPGVEIYEPVGTMGLKNLSICDVRFNEVVVPSSSILGKINEGDIIINKVLSEGKLNNGGQCLGVMKKLLNSATHHCIFNEFFKKAKYNVNFFKTKIGIIASKVYAVESITYLLTGRLDSHNSGDVFLESLIVKIFASESLRFTLQGILEIFGPEFLSNDDLVELSRNSQFYVSCDETNDNLRIILSTFGLKYAKSYKKERNIMQMLLDLFNRQNVYKIFSFNIDERLTSKNVLQGYVHNMFEDESVLLEDSVFCLQESSSYLIHKYGENVYEKHIELKYLADMVINIYVMAATLARASRAYCIGVKNQEFDHYCLQTVAICSSIRVRNLRNNIMTCHPPAKFSDISSRILQCSKYSKLTSVFESLKVRR